VHSTGKRDKIHMLKSLTSTNYAYRDDICPEAKLTIQLQKDFDSRAKNNFWQPLKECLRYKLQSLIRITQLVLSRFYKDPLSGCSITEISYNFYCANLQVSLKISLNISTEDRWAFRQRVTGNCSTAPLALLRMNYDFRKQ